MLLASSRRASSDARGRDTAPFEADRRGRATMRDACTRATHDNCQQREPDHEPGQRERRLTGARAAATAPASAGSRSSSASFVADRRRLRRVLGARAALRRSRPTTRTCSGNVVQITPQIAGHRRQRSPPTTRNSSRRATRSSQLDPADAKIALEQADAQARARRCAKCAACSRRPRSCRQRSTCAAPTSRAPPRTSIAASGSRAPARSRAKSCSMRATR